MRKINFAIVITVIAAFGLLFQTVSAQETTDLLTEFNKADKKSNQKNVQWAGKWSVSSRFYPATLKITPLTAAKFKFKIEASNGANLGEISGIAGFKGSKAYFDDKTGAKKQSDGYGCKILFLNKGKSIDVQTSEECSNYAGAGVTFAVEYMKGTPPIAETNFVQNDVFPNLTIDRKI